jgi:hypothetical protein
VYLVLERCLVDLGGDVVFGEGVLGGSGIVGVGCDLEECGAFL